jgi:uncharacterized membrane protein YfcA
MAAPETLTLIGLVFFLAGTVKGVVGLGLPTISLALLTATLGLQPAMALLLVPSFVTNLWQGLAGGALVPILRRFWALLLAVCVGTWAGVAVLVRSDVTLLSALLGLLVVVYAAVNLLRPRISIAGRAEPWLSPVVGTVTGVFTGMTGSFVFPGLPYLTALDMPRDLLIQAMGVLFLVSTVALAVSLGDHRLLSVELGTASAAGVIPALAGMALGQRLRRRLSETAFRRGLFGALLLLGLYILVRALIGH